MNKPTNAAHAAPAEQGSVPREPSAADHAAIQEATGTDIMSLVADLGQGRVSWDESATDIENYCAETWRQAQLALAASTHPQARWVPVSERLPDNDTRINVLSYAASSNGYRVIDAPELIYLVKSGIGAATHWQPLPAPPAASPDAAQDQPGAVR
jgi:hypothetical protein